VTASKEYRTLCLSNINPRIQDATIKEAIHQEFRKFGDFNIKIVQVGPERRIAYVNFKYPDDARDAKFGRENKLVLFDMPIRIDAVFPKKRYDNSSDGFGRDSINKDPSQRQRDRQDDRDDFQGFGDMRSRDHHKFPHHLHHVQPEDDDKATRTLFVGNLDINTSMEDLREVFERYGVVEDVDVKRPTKTQGNAYAFVRFGNLDMAHRAKVDMSGRCIGKLQCKIGYGKANPTNCLWIGGLGPWVSTNILEAEFDRFGVIQRVSWNEGNNYAFVLYENQDAAVAASKEMRGFPLGGQDRRLRIDFAEPAAIDAPPPPRTALSDRPKRDSGDWGRKGYYPDDRVDSDRAPRDYRSTNNDYYRPRADERDTDTDRWKQSRSYGEDTGYRTRQSQGYSRDYTSPRERDYDRASPGSKRQRVYDRDEQRDYYGRGHNNSNGNYAEDLQRGESGLFSEEAITAAQSIQELAKSLQVVWSGALVLKNSAFSTRMHLVSGNVQLVDTLMRDQTTTEMSLLKITQRLRLDQPKLDDMARRVSTSAPNGYSILLAMPGSESALEDANAKVQHRPLKNLVSYLKQKEAAGVISLPPNAGKDQELGVLHAFPPCQFGLEYLLKRAPRLGSDTTSDDHLVVVVVSGSA
jgi:RNA-binding protein 15